MHSGGEGGKIHDSQLHPWQNVEKIIKNNNKTQNCIPLEILSKKHGPHLDFKPFVFMPRLNLIFKSSESFREKITYLNVYPSDSQCFDNLID
jgi:hypothetical protein